MCENSKLSFEVSEKIVNFFDTAELDSSERDELLDIIKQVENECINKQNQKNEEIRKKLWCDVAVGVASSSNSSRITSMKEWADRAVSEFDKKFSE